MLKHIGAALESSDVIGEGKGGDSFKQWDARTWSLRKVTEWDRKLLFGGGAEARCGGRHVAFEPNVSCAHLN